MPKTKTQSNLLDTPILERWHINLEVALYILLGLIAVVACFYNLGARTISHDESLHALYSWKLYNGEGYEHNPMMHGPFLFHANALIYFLFGASDFTARIVPALFGIALVLLPALLRKELGRVGALVLALLTLISPSTLFHARYIRNDIYMMVWAMLIMIGLFRYFDSCKPKWIYLAAWAVTMSLCTKETAYMTGFIGFTFLVILFVHQMLSPRAVRMTYVIGIIALVALVIVMMIMNADMSAKTAAGVAEEVTKNLKKLIEVLVLLIGVVICMLLGSLVVKREGQLKPALALIVAYVAAIGALAVFCAAGGGLLWLIIVQLPEQVVQPQVFLILQVIFAGLGAGAGAYGWWVLMGQARERGWLPAEFSHKVMYITLAVVVIPFVLLYSTFFTNPKGLGSGTVGAISYWLAQQEVKRAGQPWYYYLIITPLYEFLPIGFGLLALIYYLVTGRVDRPEDVAAQAAEFTAAGKDKKPSLPFVAYAVYWTLLAWLLYSWAGEKMPWLMVHIVQPMLVLTARWVDDLIYGIEWREVWRKGGALLMLLTPLILFALGMVVFLPFFGQVFKGVSLTDINDMSKWLMAIIVGGALAFVAWKAWGKIGTAAAWRVVLLSVMMVAGLFTVRYACMANYVNYDTAKEFLVYAHSTPDVKQTVAELQEISRRLYGDERTIKFAYSSDATWPFEWYFDTNFPNRVFFGKEPSRESTDVPVLVVGREEIAKTEPFLGKRYYRFDRKLIWWPHQDYYWGLSMILPGQDMGKVISKDAGSITVDLQGQTVELLVDQRTVYRKAGLDEPTLQDVNISDRLAGRVSKQDDGRFLIKKVNVLEPYKNYFFLDMQDPQKRREFFDVVFYRKYTQSLADWEPSHPYALYIRKDIAAQLWDMGVAPAAVDLEGEEVYQQKTVTIDAAAVWGTAGMGNGQFSSPRNVAIGPDGSVYVLDSGNSRIQKFTPDGQFISTWGHQCQRYGAREDGSQAETWQNCKMTNGASGFLDPWGIAVDDDGFVYVADTWNHRIQKFTADGEFVTQWGEYGMVAIAADNPTQFWGPRDVVVAPNGLLYVSDTGNKRILAFTSDGQFVTQWGGEGVAEGQFSEPVGLAVDAEGRTYVADTWNQRVQVFEATDEVGAGHYFVRKWEVDSWYGQSLENKPYIAVDTAGHVFITDPEGERVLVFDATGKFLTALVSPADSSQALQRPTGIAVDSDGYIYIADPRANQVIKVAPLTMSPTTE